MKLIHLIRRCKLAYELLREYEAEPTHSPADLIEWRKALVESGRLEVRTGPVAAERWRAAIERHVDERFT